MKQNIDVKQLNELSEKAKDRLFIWERQKDIIYSDNPSVPNEFRLKPLKIGEMIEFLDEHKAIRIEDNIWTSSITYNPNEIDYYDSASHKRIKEIQVTYKHTKKALFLCDALWEKVKEILEDEKV